MTSRPPINRLGRNLWRSGAEVREKDSCRAVGRSGPKLVDAFGAWIWNEGRPADIPRLEGTRVVVIDPPPYERTWNAGRAYPLMRPSVTVTEILPAAEAARWASKVKQPPRH